jgi:hypothetical protein
MTAFGNRYAYFLDFYLSHSLAFSKMIKKTKLLYKKINPIISENMAYSTDSFQSFLKNFIFSP